MRKQYHLFFSGTVQGVGFRFTSRALAQRDKICGWVKNLSDGRVEIIAESDKEKLDSFLSGLKEEFKHNITDIEKQENKATGKYQDFQIAF
ncbi:MAG: acylphosphatase [Candidatus Omnitrophica bacterium]|nr:acylphosphatase [Candidatus Omnitrophota bacterium]MCF7876815.1 acylphosphatase [Candidatus Omnitrophota bacterium]MCF7878110.1 acylphosphatase [Candidatus Omnitrophota bacterium]MCF7892986.1 acylphosphatase [Candidatus Omnitrophota bacterium]